MSKHGDVRAGYVVIAAEKFASDGFHGASLAALAREAGVTKQALLHFFGTKEQLYSEVLADLADRLCEAIDAISERDPLETLNEHFHLITKPSLENQRNARLVVHALLDSDEAARKWPMKPYLDRLVGLVRQTPGGRPMSKTEALAWIFQLLGAIQYSVIAAPAVSGMYGQGKGNSVTAGSRAFVLRNIKPLAKDR